MKKLSLLTVIMLALFCVACNDNDDDVFDPKTETHRYLPLQVGNYWVYDVYNIRDGIETKDRRQDTIKIVSESIIRGQKYYNILMHDYSNRWRHWHTVRDSLGYLVTDKSSIFFSNVLFDTIIREYHTIHADVDTLSSEYYRMRNIKEPIITAVGKFNVLDLEDEVIAFYNDDRRNKKVHCYFAKDVGIVFRTYTYIASFPSEWIEQRLVEYCINGKKYPNK